MIHCQTLRRVYRYCSKAISHMQTTRRRFIKSAVGGGLGMALINPLAKAAQQGSRIPIGFQLYTVRGEFARDVPGTLKKLGELGYKAVEFWGYGGTPNVYQNYSASDLRKLLDDAGLKCCGMHMDLKALAKENLQRTIENKQTLAHEYLTVASEQENMRS